MMTSHSNLINIRLVVLDVDGVMTDGQLTYDSTGQESKSFSIKDGLGIKLLQRHGIKVAIITGRVSAMVDRRAKELGIDIVIQGREDKLTALKEVIAQQTIELDQCAYMGDDLPDLAAIASVGFGTCPADAVPAVQDRVHWASQYGGGAGAVRELAEYLLHAQGRLDAEIESWLP